MLQCLLLETIQQTIPPVTQTVKEVLQSLVDDGLVQADKIGSSNCSQAVRLCPSQSSLMSTLIVLTISLLELSLSEWRGGWFATYEPLSGKQMSMHAYHFMQLSNRLQTAKELQTDLRKQLQEVLETIQAEKEARSETVKSICLFHLSS